MSQQVLVTRLVVWESLLQISENNNLVHNILFTLRPALQALKVYSQVTLKQKNHDKNIK